MKGNFGCLLVLTAIFLQVGPNLSADTTPKPSNLILPAYGGGMVHSDPHLTDYIRLPIPRGNVTIVWHRSELPGEKAGAKGNGIAANGRIAACSFSGEKDNLVIYDFDGNRIWRSGDLLSSKAFFSTPIVDIYDRVIACDDRILTMIDPFDRDGDGKIIEWIAEFPYGGLPFSPVLVGNDTIVVATDRGPIYVYDINGSLIAYKYLGINENIGFISKLFGLRGMGFFSTINTPCVNGNRIYVSTQYKNWRGLPLPKHYARLYAIDIDKDNPDINKRISVAWYYEFGGPSQASPLFHNNTIYFDGYRAQPSYRRDIHIFAIEDKGDTYMEKWKVSYPRPTYASFTLDPRGGFWYIDPFGGKINRFSMEDGTIIETIDVDRLIGEEGKQLPSSVMTIFGNDTNPIMVVSGTCLNPLKANSYIIAIDLAKNNSLLWKVKIYEGPLWDINLVWGEYVVLMKNGMYRIVAGSFGDGVFALGENGSSEE